METSTNNIERGAPANLEAERTILGAILLDNAVCNEAATVLRPDDFYLDAHRRIFAAMLELSDGGTVIDLITVTDTLHRKKEVEAVGGVAYISSLVDGVPRLPSVEQYSTIVRDKSLLRSLIAASHNAIARAYEQSESAEEIIEGAESAIFQIAEDRVGETFESIPTIIQKSFGSIDKLIDRANRITGIETHFTELDNMTAGLQAADLVIVAGRPSMGKTSFAMNIAENVAIENAQTVAVFSLEMSKASLVQRMLCSQANVDSKRFRTGFINRSDRESLLAALERLAVAPLFIDDTPGISMTEMRAKCRRLKKVRGELHLIVVDYLQLMSAYGPGGKKYENRTQEVSAISRGLKALAKEMQVPVIALSQLSRAPESRGGDGKPQLADLRESGAIEQDADVVSFVYRPEVYDKSEPKDPDLEGKAEIIIAKQRNGPIGAVHLTFLKHCTRFVNGTFETPPPGY